MISRTSDSRQNRWPRRRAHARKWSGWAWNWCGPGLRRAPSAQVGGASGATMSSSVTRNGVPAIGSPQPAQRIVSFSSKTVRDRDAVDLAAAEAVGHRAPIVASVPQSATDSSHFGVGRASRRAAQASDDFELTALMDAAGASRAGPDESRDRRNSPRCRPRRRSRASSSKRQNRRVPRGQLLRRPARPRRRSTARRRQSRTRAGRHKRTASRRCAASLRRGGRCPSACRNGATQTRSARGERSSAVARCVAVASIHSRLASRGWRRAQRSDWARRSRSIG